MWCGRAVPDSDDFVHQFLCQLKGVNTKWMLHKIWGETDDQAPLLQEEKVKRSF